MSQLQVRPVWKQWYGAHLDWVQSILGYVPTVGDWRPGMVGTGYETRIKDPKHLAAFVELWEDAKKRANGKTILLPGRDAWLFEIVARLEGWDTIYRQDISSGTVKWMAKNDPDRLKFPDYYCIDSGNAGSIPKTLGCKEWALVYYSGSGGDVPKHQLLHEKNPKSITYYNNWYSLLEGTPKYYQRAVTSNGLSDGVDPNVTILQPLMDLKSPHPSVAEGAKNTFHNAALVTMAIADYWLSTHDEPKNPVRVVVKSELKPLTLADKLKLPKLSPGAKLRRVLGTSLNPRFRKVGS